MAPLLRADVSRAPDRLLAFVPNLHALNAGNLSQTALDYARHHMPRVTGFTAMRLLPASGTGYYGIAWTDPHVWFQERGTRPYVMRRLAGKTIPMWVNDPNGELADKNPKAKTRITADGRRQTLIFRKAANLNARKMAWRQVGVRWTANAQGRRVPQRIMGRIDVPQSYPGAPGRINATEMSGGRIATGNVGVRWRHPGLTPGRYMENALRYAAFDYGLRDVDIKPYYGTELREQAA